jgi:ABC-type spermidine/putrescine transport system permease subunit I
MKNLARMRLAAWGLLGPPLVFLFVVFVIPLLRATWGSVFTPDFTLAYYARICNVPVYGRVFLITLEISVMTTLMCAVLGYPTAYFLASCRARVRQLLLLCVIVPFFVSVLVRNYVWMILLQDTGLVNRTLLAWGLISRPVELMYNQFGVVVAMVNMLLPYMIFPVLSALLAIPPELGHASKSLGAGAMRTFWRVTLPLSLPGVAAGGLLVFIIALGFFITPALIGGPRQMMVSNLIEFSVRQVLNWPFAFALANALLLGTLALYGVYMRLIEGRLPRTGLP